MWYLIQILWSLILTTSDDVVGTYRISNSEFGSDKLTLNSNGTFLRTMSGCVFDLESSGIWSLRNDTISFQSLQRKDLRTMQIITDEPTFYKYVVRGNYLKSVNTPDSLFNEEYCLQKMSD